VAGVWVVVAPTVVVAPPVQPAGVVHWAEALAWGSTVPDPGAFPEPPALSSQKVAHRLTAPPLVVGAAIPGLVVTVLVQAPVQWAEPVAVPLPVSDAGAPSVALPAPVSGLVLVLAPVPGLAGVPELGLAGAELVVSVPVAVAAQLPEPARQPA
jgi:hypothetical protein